MDNSRPNKYFFFCNTEVTPVICNNNKIQVPEIHFIHPLWRWRSLQRYVISQIRAKVHVGDVARKLGAWAAAVQMQTMQCNANRSLLNFIHIGRQWRLKTPFLTHRHNSNTYNVPITPLTGYVQRISTISMSIDKPINVLVADSIIMKIFQKFLTWSETEQKTANQYYRRKAYAPKVYLLEVMIHQISRTPNGEPQKFRFHKFMLSILSNTEKKSLNSRCSYFSNPSKKWGDIAWKLLLWHGCLELMLVITAAV